MDSHRDANIIYSRCMEMQMFAMQDWDIAGFTKEPATLSGELSAGMQ